MFGASFFYFFIHMTSGIKGTEVYRHGWTGDNFF
jgi:hypothetical protein